MIMEKTKMQTMREELIKELLKEPELYRDFKELNEKILSMFTQGMTVLEIQRRLKKLYKAEIPIWAILRVINSFFDELEERYDELEEWRNEPLKETYPV